MGMAFAKNGFKYLAGGCMYNEQKTRVDGYTNVSLVSVCSSMYCTYANKYIFILATFSYNIVYFGIYIAHDACRILKIMPRRDKSWAINSKPFL